MKNRKLILAGLFTLIAASAVVLAGPSSSVWDNYWREALDLEDEGLVAMYSPSSGSLYDNDSTRWTATLEAGRYYKIFGVCDGDCTDLDLELRDEFGNLVNFDRASNDHPYVMVTPRYTQRYSINVKMADCWSSPCAYALGIYAY